jgi:DNA polymerase-4
VIETLLRGIVDRVARRMRNADRIGRTVTVRFRYDDFTRATRARSLAHATAATQPLSEVALAIVRNEHDVIASKGLTLIGIAIGGLEDAAPPGGVEQLLLPFGRKDQSSLDRTLDSLRSRFGGAVLTRASLLGKDIGWEVPKLPD